MKYEERIIKNDGLLDNWIDMEMSKRDKEKKKGKTEKSSDPRMAGKKQIESQHNFLFGGKG